MDRDKETDKGIKLLWARGFYLYDSPSLKQHMK